MDALWKPLLIEPESDSVRHPLNLRCDVSSQGWQHDSLWLSVTCLRSVKMLSLQQRQVHMRKTNTGSHCSLPERRTHIQAALQQVQSWPATLSASPRIAFCADDVHAAGMHAAAGLGAAVLRLTYVCISASLHSPLCAALNPCSRLIQAPVLAHHGTACMLLAPLLQSVQQAGARLTVRLRWSPWAAWQRVEPI